MSYLTKGGKILGIPSKKRWDLLMTVIHKIGFKTFRGRGGEIDRQIISNPERKRGIMG